MMPHGLSLRRLVKALAHFPTSFEVRHVFPIDCHRGASFRIAPDPHRVLFQAEGTESAKLDPVAARYRSNNFFKNHFNDLYSVALTKVRVLSQDALLAVALQDFDVDGLC
jgi:hypothetical protein